jgi:hypothetical protein
MCMLSSRRLLTVRLRWLVLSRKRYKLHWDSSIEIPTAVEIMCMCSVYAFHTTASVDNSTWLLFQQIRKGFGCHEQVMAQIYRFTAKRKPIWKSLSRQIQWLCLISLLDSLTNYSSLLTCYVDTTWFLSVSRVLVCVATNMAWCCCIDITVCCLELDSRARERERIILAASIQHLESS